MDTFNPTEEQQRLKTALDKNQPRWWYEWATGGELDAFARDTLSFTAEQAQTRLRNRVVNRLIPIINAALDAELVQCA